MGSGCSKQKSCQEVNAEAIKDSEAAFKEAMESGKIKPLRLVSLCEDGTLAVNSVSHEFTDEYFENVGICSYTWGHDRVDWFDRETGRFWKISSRAELMCKAALEFFDLIWIDGLCMIQDWPGHIRLNMGFMGKLYYHGTVVTEMCIGLRPEYCYRGWVQQEISFTKVLCVIKPLNDFVNSEGGKCALDFVQAHRASMKRPASKVDMQPFVEKNKTQDHILAVLKDVSVYLLGIQRIMQGRDNKEFSDVVEDVLGEIDGIEFWLTKKSSSEIEMAKSTFHVYSLLNKLVEGISPVIKLPREVDEDKVLMGALSSYRTGFFRYNTDRTVASFALAEYALNKEPGELIETLESFFPHSHPSQKVDVIIANPGKWCSGFKPKIHMQTIKVETLPQHFLPFVTSKEGHGYRDFNFISKTTNLDFMFSVIHSLDASNFEKYEYVAGYKKIGGPVAMLPDYGVFLGIRNKQQPSAPVLGLINVTVTKSLSFFVSKSMLGNPNDWVARAIALLNSSYHVYRLGCEDHTINQSPDDILNDRNLPMGDYFTPVFSAIQFIQFILGAVSEYASFNPFNGDKLTVRKLSGTVYKGREKEVLDMMKSVKTEFEELEWGGESWEHTEI